MKKKIFFLQNNYINLSILLIFIFAICGLLGLWQLKKSQYTFRIYKIMQKNYYLPYNTENNLSEKMNFFSENDNWKSYKIYGKYDLLNQQFVPNKFLTNQQITYEIITPFKYYYNNKEYILFINRGWIFANNKQTVNTIDKNLHKEHWINIKVLKLLSKEESKTKYYPYFKGLIYLDNIRQYIKTIQLTQNCNIQDNIYGIIMNENFHTQEQKNKNLINQFSKPNMNKYIIHIFYTIQWFVYSLFSLIFLIYKIKNTLYRKT